MTAGQHAVELRRFPSTRTGTVRAIRALARRPATGELEVSYRLDGDLSALLIPQPVQPRIGSELWRHTCFEIFIAVAEPAYHEFNFSPSGGWTVYGFDGYRQRSPVINQMTPPRILVKLKDDRLELQTAIDLGQISEVHHALPWRLGLSAVIEATDGTLSYWALQHPPEKPDFHRAKTFVLCLDPPQLTK
jgi:hypothetical protein